MTARENELADRLESIATVIDVLSKRRHSEDGEHLRLAASTLRANAARIKALEEALKEMLEMGELFIPTKLHSPGFKRARAALGIDMEALRGGS